MDPGFTALATAHLYFLVILLVCVSHPAPHWERPKDGDWF